MSTGAARSANELAQDRTDLAIERTAMAADRTLMAWIRTALSMISFGFTIYKFLEEVRSGEPEPARPQAPRNLGLTLVCLGVISVVLASIHHIVYLKRLGNPTRAAWRDMTLWVAGSVGLIGLFALLNMAFHLGPF
jgi:putative membrane protein